jgi:serine/threonine-protein kinase PRP4
VLLIAINFTPLPHHLFTLNTVLGIPYDPALDIWSVGCTLYELYTGKILLPGRSNNQMLLLMMELKGRFNQKTIKKAKFGDTYFDEMGGFDSIEKDRVTGAVSLLGAFYLGLR